MNPIIGQKLTHKHRGEGIYTEECDYLQKQNPDTESIFVELDGDIQEVTKYLIEDYRESWRLVKQIEERMSQLRTYINQKELNELEFMRSKIEHGIEMQKRAKSFLKNVPIGEYDSGGSRKYPF